MYIHDETITRSTPGAVIELRPRCACGGSHRLGAAPVRLKVKEKDVPIEPATAETKGICRRVRAAVSRMSYSSDPVLQNTARRIVEKDVTIRFIGDLRPVADVAAALRLLGIPDSAAAATLQTFKVMEIPGSYPALIPKQGLPRAFERNRIVYIPTHAVEPRLSIDIVHETNHALNPIRADPVRDSDGHLFESFIAEVRATLVADYRDVTGSSNRGNYSLALERAIDDASQQAALMGWTKHPAWKAVLAAAYTWRPDGNLDNRK